MFKELFAPILGVIAFIVVVGLFVQKSDSIKIPGVTPLATTSATKTITVGSKVINIEVVDTPDKRAQGLSGRTELAADTGMLFVFGTEGDAPKKDTTPSFWMKDMKMAIDIIWINDDKVVKIDKNVPIPTDGTPDNKLPTYSPGQPIDYVLEVTSGFLDLNNIKVGDAVDLTTL